MYNFPHFWFRLEHVGHKGKSHDKDQKGKETFQLTYSKVVDEKKEERVADCNQGPLPEAKAEKDVHSRCRAQDFLNVRPNNGEFGHNPKNITSSHRELL